MSVKHPKDFSSNPAHKSIEWISLRPNVKLNIVQVKPAIRICARL